jgi:hypothetical protein
MDPIKFKYLSAQIRPCPTPPQPIKVKSTSKLAGILGSLMGCGSRPNVTKSKTNWKIRDE